jgi:hypothetical protein
MHVIHFPQDSSKSLPRLTDGQVKMTSRTNKENRDVMVSTPYSEGKGSNLDLGTSLRGVFRDLL